jgi:hypothetical protein
VISSKGIKKEINPMFGIEGDGGKGEGKVCSKHTQNLFFKSICLSWKINLSLGKESLDCIY